MPAEKGTVLYVGGFEMPDKNAAAHRVLNNAKILRELGYNVVFCGISNSATKLEHDVFQGFECYSVPYPKSKGQWIKYLTDIKLIKEIASKCHQLKGMIFYNYHAIPMLRALRYCKRNKIWTIADVTEWYVVPPRFSLYYIMRQLDTTLEMRYANKKADGIIAISTYLNDYYTKCGCRNVIQIPPLVDLSEEKWKKSEYHRYNDKIRLVYAGTPGDIKDDFLTVIKAVARFKDDFELHILGVSKADITPKLTESEINEYLGNNVVIHGRVSHMECLKEIKASDFQIFIRPDNLVTRAGFPTKLGESFACGTPVITNLSSNIGDYLVEGNNCFIIGEASDDAMKDALDKVLILSESEINKMKQYCAMFERLDYRSYIDDIKGFLVS